METTEDRVKRIVSHHLGLPAETLNAAADIVKDLGADSLDRVEIVMCVEDEFGIEISDEDAEPFRSIADICVHVDKHTSATAA